MRTQQNGNSGRAFVRPNNGESNGFRAGKNREGESPVLADPLQDMRQTLLVFAGGSGVRIGTQVKARMIRRFGKALPSKIRLLAFDTTRDPYAVPLDDGGGELVELEEGAELFVISDIPVARIARNLHNHPSIEERLGSIIGRLPARVMRDGTKSNRPLGLLALYWKYGKVIAEVRKAIRHLVNRDTLAGQSFEEQVGLNIFIAVGLGGGTGSSVFLDLAYILRSLIEELGIPGEFCRITGIGILPLAFPGIPSHNLYPNTAAALKELPRGHPRGPFRPLLCAGRGGRARPGVVGH
jgi:hypothetical protein